MYVNVFFVIRRLYSAENLTLVREQRFIRIMMMMMMMMMMMILIININAIKGDILLLVHMGPIRLYIGPYASAT